MEEEKVYTVISATGYQWRGDTWNYRGEFTIRKQAQDLVKRIMSKFSDRDGYFTGIIGETEPCSEHEFCVIGDTSKLKVKPSLRAERMHINVPRPKEE